MKFSLQCVRKKTVEQVSLENIAESIQRHNWQADMHSKLIRIKKIWIQSTVYRVIE